MTTLIIERTAYNGNITIRNEAKAIRAMFVGYTLRNALREYRRRNNLVGKHLNIINI